jgi:hypothetical protein
MMHVTLLYTHFPADRSRDFDFCTTAGGSERSALSEKTYAGSRRLED